MTEVPEWVQPWHDLTKAKNFNRLSQFERQFHSQHLHRSMWSPKMQAIRDRIIHKATRSKDSVPVVSANKVCQGVCDGCDIEGVQLYAVGGIPLSSDNLVTYRGTRGYKGPREYYCLQCWETRAGHDA